MNYVGFGIGLIGSLMGAVAAYYERYGFYGASVGGQYQVTLAMAAVGLIGAALILLKKFRLGAWTALLACVGGAFASLELWLAPGSFFLACCLIGFSNHSSTSRETR